MGLINKLFKKKEQSWRKEKYIPEYHKCPMCGEMVKTSSVKEPPLQYYMDGERKITIKDIIDSLNFCEHCGYIYEGYDYEIFVDDAPNMGDEQKAIATSDEYKNIFHDDALELYYKKMLLMKLTRPLLKLSEYNSLYYDYKYYFDNNDNDKERELLEKKLKIAMMDSTVGTTVRSHTLYYVNQYRIHIGQKEIVSDILRRLGRFEEASNVLHESIKENPQYDCDIAKQEYVLHQFKLIEVQDKRHI